MPPRRRVSRVTSKSTSKPPTTFHQFPLLPPELRQQIWSYTLKTTFVPIQWSSTRRLFTSPRKPPSLLSINKEARAFGLKHYQLSFASSPEFARVYFDFERDILYVDWEALGPAPGRLGVRKIREEEVEKVQSLLINEVSLLEHAEENMRELAKFKGLKNIAVICDKELLQSGSQFGKDEMAAFGEAIEGEGEERWPTLVCLRDEEDGEGCSRHWWFDGWNQRASTGQKVKWEGTMSECLKMTLVGHDEVEIWGMDMVTFHMGYHLHEEFLGPWDL